MTIHESVLQTIGNTPIVKLNHFGTQQVNLYVKLEYFNPMGSVKDRMALAMIEDAEKSGALKPGQTVIEATSGNTGIGLAMVCARKGYPLVVTMMESASLERRKLLRFLGAKVVLTPAAEKGTGIMKKAEELADKHDYFIARQFENEANARIHSKTTALEILEDFPNGKLDYWVSGFGTGGTVKGVSRTLKERSPFTKIVVAEPDNARMLGSKMAQPKSDDGRIESSHPYFRPHPMQGWTPDFISKLMEEAMQEGWVDDNLGIDGQHAMDISKQLAQKEGIFCGITAGATVAAGLKIAEEAAPGSNILCMVPDTGERYLSTPLFDGIGDDMSEAEMSLSESTPSCRFVSDPGVPADFAAIASPAPNIETSMVQKIISDNPVVIFAMEWCEFCWATEKLCKSLELDYHLVKVDSAALQSDGTGNQIRKQLKAVTGIPTIPQIFIGGEYLGGNSEMVNAYLDGSLQNKLQVLNLSFNDNVTIDLNEMMPKWVQSSIA